MKCLENKGAFSYFCAQNQWVYRTKVTEKTMKKNYIRPTATPHDMNLERPILALSFDDGKDIKVNPNETHEAEEAMTKQTFDFSWED